MSIKKFDSFNKSRSKFQPFYKAKIKIKNEVVPMNLSIKKRVKKSDSHVDPKRWNKLINNKETFLLDVRKPFEHKVGTFRKSFNPNVDNFRDFPKYLKKLKKNQPIAMFCTGGIRCEKASVYLEKKGFKNVYQLKGGILNYLKNIKKKDSLWRGECFVFDNRISLKHGLVTGKFSIELIWPKYSAIKSGSLLRTLDIGITVTPVSILPICDSFISKWPFKNTSLWVSISAGNQSRFN